MQKVIFLLREPVDDFRKYYEPKVVSLGPIHHGNPKYQLGENYKLPLTYEFIEGSGKNVEDVYNMIKEKIYELRTCFKEEVTKKYDDEALTSIMIVDSCAILQYIYCATNNNKFKELNIKTDSVAFGQQNLFLLENQLPYCLLTWLMSSSVKKEEISKSIETYIDLHVKAPADQQSNWLSWRLCQRSKPQEAQSAKEESHDEKKPEDCTISKATEPVHLLDHLRTRMLHGPMYIHDGKIKFTKQFLFRGQLHLPPIVVDVSTRPKFLNLIAYEMCLDFENDFGVTSYISFLDSLINEAKDVKMLTKAQILHNFLGSDEVAKLFNEIGTDLVPNIEIYRDVRSQIQKHYKRKWLTLIAQVFHDHFSSPWTFIAFFGALLALALTITQTWYAVNSPPGPCDNFCKNLTLK
uniref:Uncharacterized protein n=1 Tax=Quercus lobata TaxID=97700 RepID=A0A7N2M2U9_QUELO